MKPTEDDILFGRGGDINKHPGNVHFRNMARELAPSYVACGESKEEKYEIKKSVPLLNSEGNSYYQAGDFNQAIISFTAAIRKILNTDGEDTALLAHFRSLSQRSEAYLALSNFEQAHTDARNALDLYNNCGYYFSAGLHPGELAAAIDRVKRTMLAGLLHHAVGNSASVAGHSSYKKKSFHRRCQWAFI